MNLADAIAISAIQTAKLAVNDPDDPCYLGTNTEFGILYMWTQGHTAPLTLFGNLNETTEHKHQDQCVCGEYHGLPEDPKLLWHLHYDERWEPCLPDTPLKSLARCANDLDEPTETSDDD